MKLTFLLVILLMKSLGITWSQSFEDADEQSMHPKLKSLPFDQYVNQNELDSKYWIDQAQAHIKQKLSQKLNTNKAKNIIMFLGDGMSVHTLTATRIFLKDTSHQLSFEKFPYTGLAKTYCVDAQVADSACTATAYLAGVKSNMDIIGVTAAIKKNECSAEKVKENSVEGIAKWAQDAKKATGFVTTTRVTHASPAGLYAHTANRDWECDALITEKSECSAKDNTDIADQLVHWPIGKEFKVVLGGGRSMFMDKSMRGEEGDPGNRTDNRNLIKEWLDDRGSQGNAKYVWNWKDLMATDVDKTDYLLGLFSSDHCPYNGDRVRHDLQKADPSLSEMTEVALKILQKENNGYFLFVEGGRIDHAHHYVLARKALEDTEEFAKAVDLARKMTSEDDTLIVVTSDHAHTMTINGYPNRGSDILGLSGTKDKNKKLFTTISYANGAGFYTTFPKNRKGPRDLDRDDFSNAEYEYPGGVPMEKESHGGEDVGIFASGPKAHLFVGNYEQSYIPMLMAKISEIGPYSSSGFKVLSDEQKRFLEKGQGSLEE